MLVSREVCQIALQGEGKMNVVNELLGVVVVVFLVFEPGI